MAVACGECSKETLRDCPRSRGQTRSAGFGGLTVVWRNERSAHGMRCTRSRLRFFTRAPAARFAAFGGGAGARASGIDRRAHLGSGGILIGPLAAAIEEEGARDGLTLSPPLIQRLRDGALERCDRRSSNGIDRPCIRRKRGLRSARRVRDRNESAFCPRPGHSLRFGTRSAARDPPAPNTRNVKSSPALPFRCFRFMDAPLPLPSPALPCSASDTAAAAAGVSSSWPWPAALSQRTAS